MATHKSALKEHRQNVSRRASNRAYRSRLRTAVKRCRAALEAGDAERARELLPATASLLDRTSKVGAIHANAASRVKARLARAANKLAASR